MRAAGVGCGLAFHAAVALAIGALTAELTGRAGLETGAVCGALAALLYFALAVSGAARSTGRRG